MRSRLSSGLSQWYDIFLMLSWFRSYSFPCYFLYLLSTSSLPPCLSPLASPSSPPISFSLSLLLFLSHCHADFLQSFAFRIPLRHRIKCCWRDSRSSLPMHQAIFAFVLTLSDSINYNLIATYYRLRNVQCSCSPALRSKWRTTKVMSIHRHNITLGMSFG